MNYLIHNESCIRDKGEWDKAKAIIESRMGKLKRLGANYPQPLVLDLFFHRFGSGSYAVSAVINLRGEIIYIKESGSPLDKLLQTLFDQANLRISRKINRDRRDYQSRRSRKQSADLVSRLTDLKELKQRNVREEFNHILHLISHDAARYIRRRLRSAEMTSAVHRGRFKVQELLDELYIKAYERISEVRDEEPNVNLWLMQLADQVLEEKLQEVEFERNHFEALDSLENREEEPADEVEDLASMSDWYSAESLYYSENEDSVLDQLTLKLNQEQIHRAIEQELARLPLFKRTIMDLYLINQLPAEEIARLKQISEAETEAVIREVNRGLVRRMYELLGI